MASDELGINDFDLSATFAIPFLGNPNTPLLVTPGFGLQLWEGPVSVALGAADRSGGRRFAAAKPTTAISIRPGNRKFRRHSAAI